jgi:tRNA1Val (adenine37-N6)-methyltransferase
MSSFSFKEFTIYQENSALKVGTDAMLLGALVECESHFNCLDIGAGTGVLSLMVAQKNPEIEIDAIEIDTLSFIDLEHNFKFSNWNNRLHGICEDFLSFESNKKYDLIVSNPPFYETTFQNEKSQVAIAKHEANLPFDQLFNKVHSMLTENGKFWIILPTENKEKWKEFCLKLELFCIKEIILFAKPSKSKRTVLVFSKMHIQTEKLSFLIRNEDNTYSDAYRELTIDFHNKQI